jgi:ketosteroid isomerase-like protein
LFALFTRIYAQLTLLRESLALFANDYHDGSRSTGRVLATIRAGGLPDKPAPRKRTDCPTVRQWTRKEYRIAAVGRSNTQRGETDGNATSVPQKAKRGRPRKTADKEDKTTHWYLQNSDGSIVSEAEIADMSRKARMLWRTLDEDGMAPQTFGQISMKAWEYFSRTMLADGAHEFLLFCDDGEWKLREWSTRSYPSWHRNRFSQEDEDVTQDESKAILFNTISY